ncbi:MAG: hypothetical protein WKF76_08295 [Nocardioidaceae bacterium]
MSGLLSPAPAARLRRARARTPRAPAGALLRGGSGRRRPGRLVLVVCLTLPVVLLAAVSFAGILLSVGGGASNLALDQRARRPRGRAGRGLRRRRGPGPAPACAWSRSSWRTPASSPRPGRTWACRCAAGWWPWRRRCRSRGCAACLVAGDRDSLGLFQQRPSQGWGTREQLLDPRYAAGQFYRHLLAVPGWRRCS